MEKYAVRFKMFFDGKSDKTLGEPKRPQAFLYGPFGSEQAALDVARKIQHTHRYHRHEVAVEPLRRSFDPATGR